MDTTGSVDANTTDRYDAHTSDQVASTTDPVDADTTDPPGASTNDTDRITEEPGTYCVYTSSVQQISIVCACTCTDIICIFRLSFISKNNPAKQPDMHSNDLF